MKKLLLTLIFCFCIQSVATAEWTVETRIDAMTDEVKKTARVENELGHTFSVYRISEGGAVWGNFALSEGMYDQVDWQKPPLFRIDKNEPIDLADIREIQKMVGIKTYEWEPKWVNFQIWHGKEEEGIGKTLVQLMEGETVVFRYYLSTGGYKDTSFSLEGAASAIAEAIGITKEIDRSAQKKSEEYRKAVTAATERCMQDMSTFQECFSKVKECMKKAGHDIHKFKSCLHNSGK